MTSRERLLRTLRREPVDRVPISTYELNAHNPDNFENQSPSYARLMAKIRTDSDCIYMWSWEPWVDSLRWDRREERDASGTVTRYSRLRTPLGDLTMTEKESPDVHTVWRTEHLLKDAKDAEAYLRVLPELFQLDEQKETRAREAYMRAEDRLGDAGIIMNNDGDPSYYACELFEFGAFTLMCLEHRDLVLELIDALAPPILEKFRRDAANGFGLLYRMVGPEYYTPPYLSPDVFREMVVPGATRCASILNDAGIVPRIHSHGNVRGALPMIVEIGAKALDPIEPPPDGDITLCEVKELYGDKLVLFGNTELKLLEHGTVEEVREAVRFQMASAKDGGGYVLMPTAAPINEPLAPQTERNYFAWIDAGLEFGVY